MLRAAEHAQSVVATIFVNPSLFAPQKDLTRNPRDRERDRDLLRAKALAAVFTRAPEEMYRLVADAIGDVPSLSRISQGALPPRPVQVGAPVVSKLFYITQPDLSVIG